MIAEAQAFADEDETQRQRVESLNTLESFIYSIKLQLGDMEGVGGRLKPADKQILLSAIHETKEWLEGHSSSAAPEDFAEKLAHLQDVVNPIMADLYADSTTQDDPMHSHDEL
jgi:heat shock protein 5